MININVAVNIVLIVKKMLTLFTGFQLLPCGCCTANRFVATIFLFD